MSVIERIAVWILPVLLAIIIHEIAHGWAALKLGDTTAKSLGRLTLNPISHIDPVGTLIVPGLLLISSAGFLFGWAKPVPVNFTRLNNPRRDMAIVALAGPFSNLIMMLGWAFIAKLCLLIDGVGSPVTVWLFHIGAAGMLINAALMMLNLLPIPPLDGSRVVERFLPINLAIMYNQVGRYGLIIMVILLYTGLLSNVLGPLISWSVEFAVLAANLPTDVLSAAYSNLFSG